VFAWLLQVELEGLTGHVAFDENGHRRDFELSVNELILNTDARPVCSIRQPVLLGYNNNVIVNFHIVY